MTSHPVLEIRLKYYGERGLSQLLRKLRDEDRFFLEEAIAINGFSIKEKANKNNSFEIAIQINSDEQPFLINGWVNQNFILINSHSPIRLANKSLFVNKDKNLSPYLITITKK